MARDPLSPELRAIEHEIDDEYLKNPLVRRPIAEAIWFFLSYCEDLALPGAGLDDPLNLHEVAAFADNLLVHSKWPLKWLWQTCAKGGDLRPAFEPRAYEAASMLSKLASDYVDFETVFTYASLGLVTIVVAGNRLTTSGPMRNDSRFDAYDRFMLNRHPPAQSAAGLSFLDAIASSVRVSGNRFSYDINPQIVRSGLASLGEAIDAPFSLPTTWGLPQFTILDFGKVARVLYIMTMAHITAHGVASSMGRPIGGFHNAVMLWDRKTLTRRLCQYTGISADVTSAIVENLTYGSRGQMNPDPALQPLIPLSSSHLAISPSLVSSSSMERNLAVLLNRLPEEREAYAKLSQEKESALRRRLEEDLADTGFRFWYGEVTEWGSAADVDFAIVSDSEQRCLILELKSFIAPAEPREIVERSEEIRRGIEQVRRRADMAQRLPGPLLSLLRVDSRYRLTWAVASETSIGAGYVQSPDVPVINVRHLVQKLRRNPELGTCCPWLEGQQYLPDEGSHFRKVEIERKVGKWVVEWYGLTDFVDNYE